MLFRILIRLLAFLWILLLTSCLGGGGGGSGDGGGTDGTIQEVTDNRVSKVTLLVTDDFQRANGESPIILTIIARDRTNAPLADVEVSLASSSDFAVLITPKGVTEENGRFTTGIVSSVAETLEVIPTAGGLRGESATVTFIAPVDFIELTASEDVLSVGDSTTVTVKIRKELTDDPLPNTPFNVTVSGVAEVSGVPNTTDSNGQATFTVSDDTPEIVTVTVTSGAHTQTLELYFGATLSLVPDSINALDTATLTALLKNNNNAPIAGQEIQFNFIGENNETLTPISAITRENGTALVTITDLANDGGTAEVQASSGTLTARSTVRFGEILVDPRIALVKLTVTDDFQLANGSDKTTLTVIARDAANAPIIDVPVHLTILSDTAFIETLTGTTGKNGRFTTTVTNSKAEEFQVTATAGGVSAAPVTVTFISSTSDSRVAKVNLIVTNNYQPANGHDEITLTVIVREQNNAPLAELPINLVSSSEYALFKAINGITGENGRFSTTVTSSISEEFNVTATAGNMQDTESITFVAPVGEMVLRASNVVLPINGKSTITVTILRKVDIEELLEKFSKFFDSVSVSGVLFEELLEKDVLLPDTPFQVKVIAGNRIRQEFSGRTSENGQTQFEVTNNHAENVVVTVTSGSVIKTIPLYFGATLNLLPSQKMDAIETATLTALLKDGYHAPLTGQEVTFQFANINNETLIPNTAITEADGTAIVTVTDLENNGGIAQVIANSGSELKSEAVTINFKAAFGLNRQLVTETTATVLTTNQAVTITAHITDEKGLPIAGQSVDFSVVTVNGEPSHAQILSSSGISDSNGEVKASVSNTTSENVIVTVQADTAKQEIPLYFGANIRLTPLDAEGIADSTKPVTLTAIVSDGEEIGIAGISVNISVISGQAFLDNFRSVTDELGRTTVNVTSETVGEDVKIEARADGLKSELATLNFSPNEPSHLTLISSTDSLSLNGEATITATIKDIQGNLVKDGTPVYFTTTIGTITESDLTDNGRAEVQFSSQIQAGISTITATAGTATDSITISIQPGNAGTIEVNKVEPQVIGIIGSGVAQSAILEFLVKDSLGNPIGDGTPVHFSLGDTILGGGESITIQGETNAGGKTATGTTTNGLVSVTLKSGAVAGNIDVIATVNEEISTVARVTIVGSVPDANHLSLTTKLFNIAGGVTFGLLDPITAFVGDRFGNIVPDGTSVSFITEGGTIGTSIGGGAFTTTTELGQATAILQSAEPSTPHLGGIPTLQPVGYECSGNYALVVDFQANLPLCGNPGLVTIVAFTTGSESFIDKNGDGQFNPETDQHSHPGFIDTNNNQQWDMGEVITGNGDISEPYIDGNDNFIFEEGELYIDVNSNNRFDGPDGIFQSNTTIWQSIRILFSDRTAEIEVEPTFFQIPNGESQLFTIKNIGDVYGNALVKNAKFQVTTNNGQLGGTTDFTFSDTNEPSNFSIQFTLASNPPERITETDNDGNEKTRLEYPLPTAATITITISSPLQEGAPGGNGDESFVISGTINAF